MRALGKIATYAEWRLEPEGQYWECEDVRVTEARDLCREVLDTRGPGRLTADETWRLLRAFGLPVVGTAIADTPDEAVAIAELYGYPVAVKWAAAHGEHKSDLGAVHLNITTPAGVRHAFEEISAAARTGNTEPPRVVIQPMVSNGVEMLVGVTSDPVFGPLVGVGLGGAQAQIFADARFRAAPLTDQDVDAMVKGTRAVRLLDGFRRKATGRRRGAARSGPASVHAGRRAPGCSGARSESGHGAAERRGVPDR